jgi:hypothetical protein
MVAPTEADARRAGVDAAGLVDDAPVTTGQRLSDGGSGSAHPDFRRADCQAQGACSHRQVRSAERKPNRHELFGALESYSVERGKLVLTEVTIPL